MILLAKVSFPQTSVKKAAQAYSSLPKLPATVHRIGPFFKVEPDQDIEVITIYEAQGTIWPELKKYIDKRFQTFADIPGFSLTLTKGLKMDKAIEQFNAIQRQAQKDTTLSNYAE
ncbi:MAG: hypothetical protein KJ950_04635 [Proteobacteria bacterium]|nr:hypothetical protein [Pseudomonadota bacterium]MBU1688554.1 hypothetical protein [Pseudomonadota bacterium]